MTEDLAVATAGDVDDFIDVSNIQLGNAGVVTATSFVGDGQNHKCKLH